jgi:hypothetical protein
MKNIFKAFFSFGLLIGSIASFISCKKPDSEIAYGMATVYMPQAINLSAGVDNNYPVPSGTDSTTYNYKVDAVNKKLNIILGVSVSGEAASVGYTVNIKTNADTVNQLIANGTLDASTVLMPASIYSLPTQVSVLPGARGNTFYLSVDINQLKANYMGKKLALAVKLSDPTNYALNESISKAIVIVNVSSLNL